MYDFQNSVTFSEEAAWQYLHMIQGNGPRVSGTKYHLEKTKDLKDLIDSIAAQSNLSIRTDWQNVSGRIRFVIMSFEFGNKIPNLPYSILKSKQLSPFIFLKT